MFFQQLLDVFDRVEELARVVLMQNKNWLNHLKLHPLHYDQDRAISLELQVLARKAVKHHCSILILDRI